MAAKIIKRKITRHHKPPDEQKMTDNSSPSPQKKENPTTSKPLDYCCPTELSRTGIFNQYAARICKTCHT